ncbi:MAG TPA: hypothetical protein VFP65_23775 [Anaeromyxobacteraceae bacterium]|nr:hypothetical protein [Anaeromyxobacteraceae bacterium]
MPPVKRVYTDAQREAVIAAYTDRGIRPARLVAELAASGQLAHDLEPFTIPIDTVRDLVRRERARRRKRAAQAEPQNAAAAIDALRADLLSAARAELLAVGRLRRTDDPNDDAAAKRRAGRLREIARAIREAAAIPDSSRPSPSPGTKPGQRDPAADGQHAPGAAKPGPTSLAGGILAAHRGVAAIPAASTSTPHTHIGAPTEPAPDAHPNPDNGRSNANAGPASDGTTDQQNTPTDDQPGSAARAEVERRMAAAAAAVGGRMDA